MSGLFIGVFLFFASIVFPLHAEEPSVRDMRVTNVFGQVTLKTAAYPKAAAVVDEETPLAEEDIIETGPKSLAELTLDGESVFRLQPNTRLRMKKLLQTDMRLELIQGAMLAKVKPATSSDQGIVIKMPTAVVAIRGTEFAVEAVHGVAQIGVFDEGHVMVAGVWGHEFVNLSPHQETKVTLSNVPRPPHPLDHFKKFNDQLPRLRDRVVFWHTKWRSISDAGKHQIRDRLADPHLSKSQDFLRPSERRPTRRAIRKHGSHLKHQKQVN
jgi:hypothetical protein